MAALTGKIFLCLVAFLISNALAKVTKDSRGSRIVGGELTTIDKAPYTMQLRSNNHHFCGATLVDPMYVVTAGHCFTIVDDPDNVVVVGGANTRTDGGIQRRIAQRFTHPEYTRDTYHSDVVVLKLDAPMVGKNISPIPLCSRPVKQNDVITVTGWGQISQTGPLSEQLRIVRVPVVSDESCRSIYTAYVKKNMFCAFEPGKKDACGGDSGGPAVRSGELCGIVAFGYECAGEKLPGVYTDVFTTLDFINSAMRK